MSELCTVRELYVNKVVNIRRVYGDRICSF